MTPWKSPVLQMWNIDQTCELSSLRHRPTETRESGVMSVCDAGYEVSSSNKNSARVVYE